ncbi:hypothetical protein DEU56DRAFT_837488 [Suillus clintonianus]|uniref:uncharacterized protein n=1 Tax=Suillus clintonianus TaxID=1904413 RepID=UPI001B876A70|nr:uncharacterized protein DEU56DRAFT_837488 [Suillus clintonianus]KAG2118626.1 hypothetical protein DEU56DRAFT_837488 [Suillus clintonianus]
MDKDADDTASPLSSTTARPKLLNSEPDIRQDAAITHIQSSEVVAISTTSIQTSSHGSTRSSECSCQQPSQTHSSSAMSIPPMHDGPHILPPAFDGVPESCNCSCVSLVIAPIVSHKSDPQSVVASGAVEKSVSNADDCPAPCAEGTASVKTCQEDYTHVEPAVISPSHTVVQHSTTCDSCTVQTPFQAENQDNPSSATDARCCGARESVDCMVPIPATSDACGSSAVIVTPNCCPSVDHQSTCNAASDCTRESCNLP